MEERGVVLAGRWAEGRGEEGAVDGSAGGRRRAGWLHEGRPLLHCEPKQWAPMC